MPGLQRETVRIQKEIQGSSPAWNEGDQKQIERFIMGFLKSIASFIIAIFSAPKKPEVVKSVEGELIEIIKQFIADKDFATMKFGLMAILGEPSNWSSVVSKDRIDYVIFTASNGKILNVGDFLDKYSNEIPSVATFLFNSFK
jgi:hypothetical protein